MSVKLVKAALKSSAVGADRLALVVLAHLSNEDGGVEITYKELAPMLNVNRRNCIRTMTRLMEDDHIDILELGTQHLGNRYRVRGVADDTPDDVPRGVVHDTPEQSRGVVSDTPEIARSVAGDTPEPPTAPVSGDHNKGNILIIESTPPVVPPKTTKRKSELPDDWQPNEHANEIANEEKFTNVEKEFILAQFKDQAAASGRRQINWDRAFYTWLRSGITRNDITQRRRAGTQRQPGRGSDQLSDAASRFMSRSPVQQ